MLETGTAGVVVPPWDADELLLCTIDGCIANDQAMRADI
jgi:hypothetical protein